MHLPPCTLPTLPRTPRTHPPTPPVLQGTRQLLALASSFNDLRSFVHVSSAYTNMNAPPGSLVGESLYRLAYGDQPVNDHDLVQVGVPVVNAAAAAAAVRAAFDQHQVCLQHSGTATTLRQRAHVPTPSMTSC